MSIRSTIENFYSAVRKASAQLETSCKNIDDRQENISSIINGINSRQESSQESNNDIEKLCQSQAQQFNKGIEQWKKSVSRYLTSKEFVNKFERSLPEPDDCNDSGLLGWLGKIADITLPGGLTLPDNTDGGIVPTLFPITPAPEKTGFLVLLGLIKSLVNSKKKAEEQKQRESEMRRQVGEMNRRSEERINSMVTQIVEINRRIRAAASDLESSYSANVSKLVDNAFAPVLDSLKKEFGEEEKRSDIAKIHLDQINSLLHECSAIRASIDG